MATRKVDQLLEGRAEEAFGATAIAIIDYVVKLTQAPSEMSQHDVDRLRNVGLDDIAVHDIAQVTALFNYYNRLADGLGIADETDW